MLARQNFTGPNVWTNRSAPRRMLKKAASAEKVEVEAKVEAKMRTSDLCSALTSTSAYLLAASC